MIFPLEQYTCIDIHVLVFDVFELSHVSTFTVSNNFHVGKNFVLISEGHWSHFSKMAEIKELFSVEFEAVVFS